MAIKRIDHIAIVVEDIEQPLGFWKDALGLELTHVEQVPSQESIVAFLPSGESEIELVKPTSPISGVAKFLAKRGPGMHHICFEVDDLQATLARLKERGIELINETPTLGAGGKKIAFVHPRSTSGVLVELYELTPEEPVRRSERLDELRRRWVAEGQAALAGVMGFWQALWEGNDKKRDPVEPKNP
jgi:methylmalonyl-CoA/ethylmalonyl-CoA epimerase